MAVHPRQEGEQEASPSTPRRLRQTPMGHYLVHQSLEVRRKSLLLRGAVSGSTYPDMSASPKLRLKKKAQSGRKGMLEVKKTTTR